MPLRGIAPTVGTLSHSPARDHRSTVKVNSCTRARDFLAQASLSRSYE
jgi:hypothetical protein